VERTGAGASHAWILQWIEEKGSAARRKSHGSSGDKAVKDVPFFEFA
jgi:hypothetical protein